MNEGGGGVRNMNEEFQNLPIFGGIFLFSKFKKIPKISQILQL